jgi:hypothetical protein
MKILQDIFNADDIDMFRSYWNNNWEKRSYVNWRLGDEILDRRLILKPGTKEFDKVSEVVHRYFKNPADIWSGYQQQKFAHQIHIDDYRKDSDLLRYTMIFSMDTIPEFQTIIWKETANDNSELHQHIIRWAENKPQRISNISQTQDLDHTYDVNNEDYFADYLQLDGIYSYKAGSGVLFYATQYHCTSNWLKYPKFQHRQLLQVHILTDEVLDI